MPAVALPALTAEDVLAALRALRARQPVKFAAFYSSQLGGVVTDPALMVIPFDDHMVHRGHGIFDTAGIVNGRIYDLEAHLDRFLGSAERSKLKLPGSRERMRDIIIRTTAASHLRDGAIRYWLSSGPGSLELSPAAGAQPGFFVMIFGGLSYPERWYTEGLRVMTTTYPIKPPLYAITKATNYLPNVLMQMEAKEAGLDNGVFIDEAGYVGESSNMNVAFVTRDGVFRHPKFERVLPGARRCDCWSWRNDSSDEASSPASRCATSRWPTRAAPVRWCCSAAPSRSRRSSSGTVSRSATESRDPQR